MLTRCNVECQIISGYHSWSSSSSYWWNTKSSCFETAGRHHLRQLFDAWTCYQSNIILWTGTIWFTNAEIPWNEPSSCSNCFSGRHCLKIDLCSSRLDRFHNKGWTGSVGLLPQKERSIFVRPSRPKVVSWAREVQEENYFRPLSRTLTMSYTNCSHQRDKLPITCDKELMTSLYLQDKLN